MFCQAASGKDFAGHSGTWNWEKRGRILLLGTTTADVLAILVPGNGAVPVRAAVADLQGQSES